MHAGGGFNGGGSFHGGGYGGGYRGGYHGGFHAGYPGGAYGGRGSYAGPRGSYGGMHGAYGSPRTSAAARPWSWEGHSSRNTSPGWHQFNSVSTGNTARSAVSPVRSSASSTVGRSSITAMSRAPIADGQWHSFAAPRTQAARATGFTSFSHAGVASSTAVWHGNHGGWHGSWYGSHYHWGWGSPGWGWGWGWGCCGWAWNIGFGWGWGWWGPGWAAWDPIWAWPPYYYNPWLYSWSLYADGPVPYVLDPYPA
jgi:hypothetical protein